MVVILHGEFWSLNGSNLTGGKTTDIPPLQGPDQLRKLPGPQFQASMKITWIEKGENPIKEFAWKNPLVLDSDGLNCGVVDVVDVFFAKKNHRILKKLKFYRVKRNELFSTHRIIVAKSVEV